MRCVLLFSCALAGVAAGGALVEAAGKQTPARVVPVEVLARPKDFARETPVVISPDGSKIAYSLTGDADPDNAADEWFLPSGIPHTVDGFSLWVTEIASGKTRQLSGGRANWSPAWSPDGRYLAFYSDRDGKARLWVWDTQSDTFRSLSSRVVKFAYRAPPVWSRDSRKILTTVFPDGWSVETANTATKRVAAPEPAASGSEAAKVRVLISPAGAARTDHAEQGFGESVNFAALVSVDIATGTAEVLTPGASITWYRFAPDGRKVVAFISRGAEDGNNHRKLYDLVISDLGAGQGFKTLFKGIYQYHPVFGASWSPDGRYLALTASGVASQGEAVLVPIEGGAAERIVPPAGVTFSSAYAPPRWSADGKRLFLLQAQGDKHMWQVDAVTREVNALGDMGTGKYLHILARQGADAVWSPDKGKSIVALARNADAAENSFVRVDVSTGRMTVLLRADKLFGGITSTTGIDVTESRGRVVYIAEAADQGPNVWETDNDFRRHRKITTIRPELSDYKFGGRRTISWIGPQGETLRGSLLLPPEYVDGRKYPTVVWIYGGAALSRYVNRFGATLLPEFNQHILATRGYVVFAADTSARRGAPMKDIAESLMPGINRLVEEGIADPQRLGVIGGSYGGYSVLSVITQTERFAAAVSSSGFSDLASAYGHLTGDGHAYQVGIAEDGQIRMGGTPWQFRDRYIENSPFFYLDRVTTPVLILHGQKDDTVPPFLADQTFVALRRLGKEATYVLYENMGHAISSPILRVDYWNRIIDWFDRHLKAPKAPH